MKSTPERTISRLNDTEEQTSNVEDRLVAKRKKKNPNLRDLWDNINHNTHIIEVPEGKERDRKPI